MFTKGLKCEQYLEFGILCLLRESPVDGREVSVVKQQVHGGGKQQKEQQRSSGDSSGQEQRVALRMRSSGADLLLPPSTDGANETGS